MKIYGFPLSPFVRKVVVAAREKGLEYELVPANPSQPTDEFLKVSPFSKIPALSDGDFCLADSTAIVTYLEAKHPDPALLPPAPQARGRAIWFEEVADTVLTPAGAPIVVNRFLRPKIFGTEGDESAARAAEEAIKKPLGYHESAIGDNTWLDGDFTVGDIAVACTIKTLGYTGWTLDQGSYPKLAQWFGRVTQRAAWQQAAAEETAVFASLMG
jgi:glutathione S-transferase